MIERKSKLEILDETVKYYSEDPKRRGLNDEGDCSYYIDGKMCAVGRCLNNPKSFDARFKGSTIIEDIAKQVATITPFFKPEYRGHNIQFWLAIQDIHDSPNNWSKRGMTIDCRKRYNDLKRAIREGKFD